MSRESSSVAGRDDLVQIEGIRQIIYTVRGVQVMLDRDLAKLYGVETKVLNQAVKRNITRFPDSFHFQLTEKEKDELVTICDRFDSMKCSSSFPYAFSEQGIAMLSAVLKSEKAIRISVQIIEAFVSMRRFISANAGLFQRVESLERHQIETDSRIDRVLDCLEEGTLKEKAHIFSAGRIYEAKAFITGLIGRAKQRVVLVDGYVGAETVDLLDARPEGVLAAIFTSSVGPALKMLQDQYVRQFPEKPLIINKWSKEQHDRWLIIDNELWHCGASLKDAGSKTFGIDPIGLDVEIILSQV